MSRIQFDHSEVDRLEINLSKAPDRVQRRAPRALGKGAKLVEAGLRKDATGHRYLKQLPSTVSSQRIGTLSYEIGFEKRGQGNLAHIIVLGSINNAPVFSHTASLRRALPEIERLMADAGHESVLGGDRER